MASLSARMHGLTPPRAPRATSAYDTRFLFAGSLYLPEASVYDMRNRFYHPTLSRFMQTDPIGLQMAGTKLSPAQKAFYSGGQAPETFAENEFNLYRYAHNDPVNHSDPFGLTDKEISEEALRKAKDAMKDIASAANKDHNDRTQAVLKDGKGFSLSKVAIGIVKTIFKMGRITRDDKRTESVDTGGKPVAALAHFHNDKTNNSTARPSSIDRNTVKSYDSPMVFGSESLQRTGQAVLIIPQQEANLRAREETIDFSYGNN